MAGLDHVLSALQEAGIADRFGELLAEVQRAEGSALDTACTQMQEMLRSVRPGRQVLQETGAFNLQASLLTTA